MASIDDKALEVALKPLFEVEDANKKTLAQVRQCINENTKNPAVSALVSSKGFNAFSKRAHEFLSSGAFEKARLSEAQPVKAPGTKPLRLGNETPQTLAAPTSIEASCLSDSVQGRLTSCSFRP